MAEARLTNDQIRWLIEQCDFDETWTFKPEWLIRIGGISKDFLEPLIDVCKADTSVSPDCDYFCGIEVDGLLEAIAHELGLPRGEYGTPRDFVQLKKDILDQVTSGSAVLV
jgi:hypothetical protein